MGVLNAREITRELVPADWIKYVASASVSQDKFSHPDSSHYHPSSGEIAGETLFPQRDTRLVDLTAELHHNIDEVNAVDVP